MDNDVLQIIFTIASLFITHYEQVACFYASPRSSASLCFSSHSCHRRINRNWPVSIHHWSGSNSIIPSMNSVNWHMSCPLLFSPSAPWRKHRVSRNRPRFSSKNSMINGICAKKRSAMRLPVWKMPVCPFVPTVWSSFDDWSNDLIKKRWRRLMRQTAIYSNAFSNISMLMTRTNTWRPLTSSVH